MRRWHIPALFVTVLSVAHASGTEPIQIPEKFFRGNPQPDGTVQFVYTKPNLLDPEQVANTGWWNAVAKLQVLLENNAEFRAAYTAASSDPDLKKTGVTFEQWSRGSQEDKQAARDRMHAAIQRIVAKHRLTELLTTLAVDDAQIAAKRASLLVRSPGAQPSALVAFCPGAPGNVSVDSQHPSFARFQAMLADPESAKRYDAAIRAFGEFLDAHPTSSIEARNAELERLLAPILATMR